MTRRLVVGSILGGIVLFVWSAIAWMLIPWPGEPLHSFANEDAVAQVITANAPGSGNYLLPNEPKRTAGMSDEQYKAAKLVAMDKMIVGPMIFMAVRLEPMGSMGKLMVVDFLSRIVLALIATFLLMQTSGLSYAGRVAFVTAIGVTIFLGGSFEQWNWFSFSNAYLLMEFGGTVIGWILAALVIAKVVTGKPARAHAR